MWRLASVPRATRRSSTAFHSSTAQLTQTRNFRFVSHFRIRRLESALRSRPADQHLEAALLRELNRYYPKEVIKRVESRGTGAVNDLCLLEYRNALVMLGRAKPDVSIESFKRPLMASQSAMHADTAHAYLASSHFAGHPAALSAAMATQSEGAAAASQANSAASAAGGGGLFSRLQQSLNLNPAAVATSAGASNGAASFNPVPVGTVNPGVAAATVAGGSAAIGTQAAPLEVAMASASVRSQIFSLIRRILLAGLIVVVGSGVIGADTGKKKQQKMREEMLGQKDKIKAQTITSEIRFDDVLGIDEVKQELVELVEFLKNPQKFARLNAKLPKGVLFMGPPGTGKTMLARAVAGEAGVPFFYMSGSEFEEVFVGVGAKRVRELFEAAKANAPCIVFIDEIDAVGGKRNPKDPGPLRQTLNQLLVSLDGFEANDGVIVMGATNFPSSLDSALTRPGRFDRHVTVPLPDVDGRRKILKKYLSKVRGGDEMDVEVMARGTPSFSGADLANLVNIAALQASTRGSSKISQTDLDFARDRIMMGSERKSAIILPESRRLTAFHESGHALVAYFTKHANPIHKATVIPRGQALGLVQQVPNKDEHSISKDQLLAMMDVAMGGRVAEELVFGADNVTSGASSDFDQATNIARRMVTKFGMGNLGKLYLEDDDLKELSLEMKQSIDEEVHELIEASYSRAKAILVRHRSDLDTLATRLLDKETLTGKQIDEILGHRRPK